MTEETASDGHKPDGLSRRPSDVAADGRAATGPGAAISGAPRWFKVMAVVGAVFLLLVAVLLLSGHGPSRHMHGGAAASAVEGMPTVPDSERRECWTCG